MFGLGHCQNSWLLSDSAFSQSHALLHGAPATAIFLFHFSRLQPRFQSGCPTLPCSLSPISGLYSRRPLMQRGVPMPSPSPVLLKPKGSTFGLVSVFALLKWKPHCRGSEKSCACNVRRITFILTNLTLRITALKNNL